MEKTVIMAESMEPEIGSDFEDGNIMKLRKWKADPQVRYAVCASVDVAKKWLDERIGHSAHHVVEFTAWTQGSVGHALPGFEVIGTTGASSIQRTVIYRNEFGTHKHWQQIKVEWVEGA